MRAEERVTDDPDGVDRRAKCPGHDELIVGVASARFVRRRMDDAPTSCRNPVAAKALGLQFQSPPRIHGPLIVRSTKAMSSNNSRLKSDAGPILSCI